MAPPIPGLRQPVQIRRRTPGDVLAGLGAIVLLVALTVGVPIALVTVVGLPLPHSLPKLSALTSQLDITAILRILSVIVWLAWIQLVWCVLVEIKVAVSHAEARPKVPLVGATQSLAHRLVTAALLLFTAAAALTPAVISHGPPRPAHSVSAQLSPSGLTPAELTPAIPVPQAGLTAAQVPQSHHTPNADKMYTVNPPVGRFHESLWEIAHNHLGDGRRYREIFELNSERVQPDGSKLTIASLIRPGWTLLMPKDAHGPGIQAVTPKLAGELGLTGPPRRRRLSRPRAGPTSYPPPRYWRPACWPRSAASGGSSCGSGRSAAGLPVPTRTRRWLRRPCGSARTTPRCGCSTPACGTCPASSARSARRRPRCSRLTWARRTWTCGSPRRTRTRRARGRRPTAVRCGGCRSRPSPASTCRTASGRPLLLAPSRRTRAWCPSAPTTRAGS